MRARVKPSIDPLSEAWGILGFELAPSDEDCRAMLDDLRRLLGGDRYVRQVLCAPSLTFKGWQSGRRRPCATTRKAIWLSWALILHPERCKTVRDIVTWGKLR